MTDLDLLLHTLADDLRVDPVPDPADIRRRGGQRRRRRNAVLAGGLVAGVAAVAVAAADLSSRGVVPAPMGPGTTTSTGTLASPPVWTERFHDGPQAFRNAPGGSGLTVTEATVQATLTTRGGCVVLAPMEESSLPARVLVFPVGTTWVEDGPVVGGNTLPLGRDVTVRVTISPRTDASFGELCPGTAGFALMATPDDVLAVSAGPRSGHLSGARPCCETPGRGPREVSERGTSGELRGVS